VTPIGQSPLPTELTLALPTASSTEPAATPTIIGENVIALPDPELFQWKLLLSGLNTPVGAVNAGDGSGRLFIIEQEGVIRILQNGELLRNPFLDIQEKVECCSEKGLLGLAFHPHYPENGYFYINYTELRDGDLYSVIARYSTSSDPNQADPDSEVRLIELQQPYENHNGGSLVFGPDGYLYAGLGDGGNAGDPQGYGQSLQTLLGKILRIDVDGGDPYQIPGDNPFINGGGQPEIWLYGLRNPWRFSFDRLTGDMYIGDVGQGRWEEVHYIPAGNPGGGNLGWNYFEGMHPFEDTPPAGMTFIEPVAEYAHNPDYSITGGYVYRGPSLPELYGVYIYGDFRSGFVRGLLQLEDGNWQNEVLFTTGALISSFGEDEAGEIYLVDYQGDLFRLESK
jgi:glucose/arabinose dehydrogenase